MPSASGVSNARFTASLAAISAGSDIAAMVSASFIASSIRLAAGTTRDTRPGALGFGGVHHAAGEDQVHRLGLADRARQPLRAADAGNDAELDLGLAELRGVGGDDDVALHDQLAAAAERKARDRRDHRLARIRGRVPGGGEVAHERVDRGLVRHLLDVGAGGEGLLRAGDQDAADAVVGVEGGDRLRQLGIERGVERVERLRPVEPDDADAALGFDEDGFVAHADLCYSCHGRRLSPAGP